MTNCEVVNTRFRLNSFIKNIRAQLQILCRLNMHSHLIVKVTAPPSLCLMTKKAGNQ